jgi:hypothetical protein
VRRLFWMTVGATVGIVAMRKATHAVQAMSPSGIGERWTTLGIALRVLGDEVRLGMVEREAELRGALRLGALPATPARPELTAGDGTASQPGSGRHAARSGAL